LRLLWQKEKWHGEDEKKALEMMSKILIEVLVLVDSEDPVYIVLDRADQCTCSRNRLLEKLASVAREARCTVKMVVVADSALWRIDPSDCKDLEEEYEGYLITRLNWDQQRESLQRTQKLV
jgi:hypothetical protein